MQGWGQLANLAILIVSLLIFHGGNGDPPYSTVSCESKPRILANLQVSTQWTYRVSFAIPAVGTLWLLVCFSGNDSQR
jgi:hypothetical protein